MRSNTRQKMEPDTASDPAFRAVERVLSGAVNKVLSQYRGKRCPISRPEARTAVSSDDEDFSEAPPSKKFRTKYV